MTDEHYDANPKAHSAAADHAKELYKAQRLIGVALNLVGLLLTALRDQRDSWAVQIETAVKVIRKTLKKACNRIGKHDVRNTNLFLVYVDLRDKVEN